MVLGFKKNSIQVSIVPEQSTYFLRPARKASLLPEDPEFLVRGVVEVKLAKATALSQISVSLISTYAINVPHGIYENGILDEK